MTGKSSKNSASGPVRAVFDPVAASADMGLTLEEFAPLLPKAATEIRLRLDAVRQGVADDDLRAVTLNSHTAKSIAATLGAEATRQAALDLELCARSGDRASCPRLLAELEEHAAALLGALDKA
ncbi:Hpt domain protein [Pseudodesulfovibrio mercurii]|uniref:Hpt domain protein n=1 Tax=Pseudodesulfovibrio mercurii TaxID=641491 RepID=F0JD79_9BACT|nr:Hpt domain-containing protein [Pseudodesulfovibrio mercurii]EGB15753.1 Hpt domain protein [Pseudodesulfovibrio mercurii]